MIPVLYGQFRVIPGRSPLDAHSRLCKNADASDLTIIDKFHESQVPNPPTTSMPRRWEMGGGLKFVPDAESQLNEIYCSGLSVGIEENERNDPPDPKLGLI